MTFENLLIDEIKLHSYLSEIYVFPANLIDLRPTYFTKYTKVTYNGSAFLL